MELQAKGANIHYTLRAGAGTPIVLLHGWGCDESLMKPIADRLPADRTLLTLDFPGHGHSGRPTEPWGVPEFAECLRETLQQLKLLPCDVIAHSFGGRVTLWLASHDPEMFRRILLTGAAGLKKPQTEEGKKRAEAFQKKKAALHTLRGLKVFNPLLDRAEEKLRQTYGSRDYNALDAEMRKTFVKVISQDLADCLPKVQSPTLLVWGDGDTETPLWMGQKMEREIADAALVVLEGGTHFAYLEQADRFAAIAKAFFAEDHA